MPTESKREILYYRVRGGYHGDKGVANEVRALRGVTHLRDRGFRTFRNAREPRPNTHDAKLMDLMSFVNAVAPQVKEIPWIAQTLGLFEGRAHPTIASHVLAHTHDAVTYEVKDSWDLTVGLDGGVEPPFSHRYIRGVVVDKTILDEASDFDEFIKRWGA